MAHDEPPLRFSVYDEVFAAARGLVKRKRLDAADLRDVRVLADLLVKVDEGGCVDLREAVSAVAIVARELAAMPGKRGARDNDAVEQRKAEERASPAKWRVITVSRVEALKTPPRRWASCTASSASCWTT